MTRPLPAKLVLLALAAALAACLVFSMIVAEQRDIDGQAPGLGRALSDFTASAATAEPVEELRAVPVSAP